MAAGIGSSIGAAVQSGKASDEVKKKEGIIAEQNAANEAIFNKQYYQDFAKRTEIMNMLRLLDENQKKADTQNAAKSAIMGSTPEQELANKEVTRKAYADALADIASNASSLRDNYMNNWQKQQNDYYAQRLGMQQELANIHTNTSNQWANAATNAFASGANLLGTGIDSVTGGKTPAVTTTNS